jgi:thiol:disulfide interchange protein
MQLSEFENIRITSVFRNVASRLTPSFYVACIRHVLWPNPTAGAEKEDGMSKVSAGILLIALALGVARAEEFRSFDEAKDAAFAAEERKLWKQIKWRTDAEKAIAEATKAKKPIMVFLLVNEWGKLDADQC